MILLSPERRIELEVAARSQAHVAPLIPVANRPRVRVVSLATGIVDVAPHLTPAERLGSTPVGTCERKRAAANTRINALPADQRAPSLPTSTKPCNHCRFDFLPSHGSNVYCDGCKAKAENPPEHASPRELRALKIIRDGERKRQHNAKVRARRLEESDCGHVCRHVEPYGFVPEANCPVHDIPPFSDSTTPAPCARLLDGAA